MTCDSTWTFRFPSVEGQNGPFEIQPLTLNYKYTRGKLSLAKAKFPTEVGDMMKPETRYKDGALREPTLVELVYDGEKVHTLYFKPDFARYEDQYTHLEFHDPQESLESGVCDKRWSSVSLREAYEYAFSKRRDKSLIQGIKFSIPDEVETELVGEGDLEDSGTGIFSTEFSVKQLQGLAGDVNRFLYWGKVRDIEQEATKKLSESYYALNFEKTTPAKAIWKLNDKFNVQTWMDRDGYLWVGYPEARGTMHVAAPDDERVWRYSGEEVNIRHPREPVKQVTVEGGWVNDPGPFDIEEKVDEVISWFGGDDTFTEGVVKAQGIATRTDIDYGETVVVETDAKRDALPAIAESQMREMMKNGHSGTIQIDTEISSDFTSLEHVSPGDLIWVVPNDHHFENPTATSGIVGDEPEDLGDCTSFINNEIYFVKEVQHDLGSDGYWSVTLNVGMYPDILDTNMKSSMRYFHPESGEYLTEEDVFA